MVIGYGSLMSGLGLSSLGRLQVRAAVRLALLNARRGFGKFSQHGDRFAMVLEAERAERPIEGRVLAPDTPVTTPLEAIGLVVQPNDLARLGDREGYSGGAVRRLREEASRQRQGLAAFLWSMLVEAGHDTATFRQRMFKLVSYTSPHYLPHPVPLGDDQFAVTFLAPGREGSGSERVVPVRVRTNNESLMTATEAWRRKPNRTQLDYFVTCLLGGVHGISMADVLASLPEDTGLCDRVRAGIVAEQRQELPRFLDMTGLDHAAYWRSFGPPNQAVRRSGLEQFLRG